MRRFLSALLLLFIGVMAPLAGTTVKVCLLDGSIRGSGLTAEAKASASQTKCCGDCGEKEHEECCAVLEQLPDSTPPASPWELPPAVAMDLPPAVMAPVVKVIEITTSTYRPDVPIRGPDSPAAFRAKLAVWRI